MGSQSVFLSLSPGQFGFDRRPRDISRLTKPQIGFWGPPSLPIPCTYLTCQHNPSIQLGYAYPVGTHLNNIGLAIFVFAKWLMPSPTADCIAVLENHEIMHGSIREGLL